MVNIIAHRIGVEREIYGDPESDEDELNDTFSEVNPPISRSFGGCVPKNSRHKNTLSKRIFRSFGSFANIKRKGKNSASMETFLTEVAREKPIRFSLKQLKGFTLKFSILIGSGGFGNVYKGKIPSGVQVAVKVMNKEEQSEEQFIAEVSILSKVSHKNLVRLYGYCFEADMVALVYEYVVNGPLEKILYDNHHTVEWNKLYNIAIETAKGISYLHDECTQRIIHYDIKPSNILLDAEFSPKISDFGLSKLYNRDKLHVPLDGVRGTVGYVAPEIMVSSLATTKSDVFSFGMMLFEFAGRRRLNMYSTDEQQYFPVQVWETYQRGELEKFLKYQKVEGKDMEAAKKICMVALWCINFDSNLRPSMRTVVGILKGEVGVLEPPHPFQNGYFPNIASLRRVQSSSSLSHSTSKCYSHR